MCAQAPSLAINSASSDILSQSKLSAEAEIDYLGIVLALVALHPAVPAPLASTGFVVRGKSRRVGLSAFDSSARLVAITIHCLDN